MNGCLKVLSGSGESGRDEIRTVEQEAAELLWWKPRTVFINNQNVNLSDRDTHLYKGH